LVRAETVTGSTVEPQHLMLVAPKVVGLRVMFKVSQNVPNDAPAVNWILTEWLLPEVPAGLRVKLEKLGAKKWTLALIALIVTAAEPWLTKFKERLGVPLTQTDPKFSDVGVMTRFGAALVALPVQQRKVWPATGLSPMGRFMLNDPLVVGAKVTVRDWQ